MKRNILTAGKNENADFCIIHEIGDSWGNFNVGQKSQFSFILKPNRDVENDIYLKWKCACCAEDVCSKNSLSDQLVFVQENGIRIDYLKVGPLHLGQNYRVVVEADLTGITLEQDKIKKQLGLLIFETEDKVVSQSLEKNFILEPLNIQTQNILSNLCADFKYKNLDIFLQSTKNLIDLCVLLIHGLQTYHIDFIVIENSDSALAGVLKTISYLHMEKFLVVDFCEIKNQDSDFKAASNVVIFCLEMSDQIIENIDYLHDRMGCEIIKIVTILKTIYRPERKEIDIPIEYLLSNF